LRIEETLYSRRLTAAAAFPIVASSSMQETSRDFDFASFEPKWQRYWEERRLFRAITGSPKPKCYILDMFPYPSGAGLHIGHPEGYTATDILARARRAQGFNVLHPMGWDAFGLPAEQYAVKTGKHPRKTTEENIATFRRQIKAIGLGYDWEREVDTTDPKYFRWSQWIFLQMFLRGLAYVDEKPVWWCQELGTVLANEEIVDGKSEVGGFPVERRPLRQWVLAITRYADRLLAGLKNVDWPDSTKRMQEAWIGRSEGAEVDFEIADGAGAKLRIFTTRPDTLFGATYMVIAPEHPLVSSLTTPEQRAEVDSYTKAAASKSDLERTELAKDKTGVFTGSHAINPVNGARIPIWVADYVVMGYGTGAIMAVPGHDTRDFEFAEKFNLPTVRVIKGADGEDELPFTGDGLLVNSGEFDGLGSDEAIRRVTAHLAGESRGKATVQFKLRDWLFSRQRYWGEPFPIVWVSETDYEAVAKGGASGVKLPAEPVKTRDSDGRTVCALPLPESALPLTLPDVTSYQSAGTGESPLANCTEWLEIWFEPSTGAAVPATSDKPGANWVRGRRETNTMPQWAGSCWYYLRYCDPKNENLPIGPEAATYWGVPDLYIGGAEHAVLHLLYARFWHMFLHDIGVVSEPEPFRRLFHQGTILGEMEFNVLLAPDGSPVSADTIAADAFESHPKRRLAADEVSKKDKDTFVWNANPAITVDARTFKMSKSRGNVINPDEIIRSHGADSLRLYEMFLGPLEAMKPWDGRGIEGVYRFLRKVWREYLGDDGRVSAKILDAPDSDEVARGYHATIKKVSEDIESLRFNTAISQMMIFVNSVQKAESLNRSTAEGFLKLLAPFAPHTAEELWSRLGHADTILEAGWPVHDPARLVSSTITLIVQVNGKLRGDLTVPPEIQEADAVTQARAHPKVAPFLDGKTLRKTVFVRGRLVNFVVS
jgi:leucyl-tRNA synthetase